MGNQDLEKFTDEEFNYYKEELYARLTLGKEPVESPKSYILGGQSGSGKTTLHRIFKEKLEDNAIIINGDEFRPYHPRYNELKEMYGEDAVSKLGAFSNKMVETIIAQLSDENYNLIIEGTLRTAEVPLKTAKMLKEKDYAVELGVMAVKPEISYLSTIHRYEKMIDKGVTTRITPKQHHDKIVEALPSNLDEIYEAKVFDNITLYNRSEECLYDQSKEGKSPDKLMDNVLNGNWSKEEYVQLIDVIEGTIELKKKRNALDLQEYKQKTKKLLSEKELMNNKNEITDR